MEVSVEKPRFRSDLVAQPIEEEGVRYVDVTDPNLGATFRFYDVEYSIACAMDGLRDLSALSEWTKSELGIETDIPALGLRARRGVAVIEDGVVKSIDMEAPGKFEVSSADACLLGMKK